MVKDSRFVAGAGATEIELARKIHAQGEASPGLDQYAIKKFAESLEVSPLRSCSSRPQAMTDSSMCVFPR
jgi:T-complex protein 1 subunit theta